MNPNKLHYIDKYGEDWEDAYYEKHAGIPSGWALCDGRRLSKGKFPELFDVIQDSYDVIPEANPDTFAIPDLRPTPKKPKPGEICHIIKLKPSKSPNDLPIGYISSIQLETK